MKVKFGAGFTQSFQGLKHENITTSQNNALFKMTSGFNTANANLFMDVQLADGIRLNLTSYLAQRRHNETWVKGGYLQFDKNALFVMVAASNAMIKGNIDKLAPTSVYSNISNRETKFRLI